MQTLIVVFVMVVVLIPILGSLGMLLWMAARLIWHFGATCARKFREQPTFYTFR